MLALAGMAAMTRTAAVRTDLTLNEQRTTENELCPRVELVIELLQPRPRNMRVDLRCGDVGVPKHHLYGPQVRAVFQQMRGERVTQHMRRDVRSDSRLPGIANDLHPESLT